MLNKKIPHSIFLNEYKENNFIDEDLVEIPNNIGIIIDMQYPKLGMNFAINKCLIRKEVLNMLIEAKKKLPEGITLKIWDAYRPLSLQKELFYKYKNKIIKDFNLDNLSENEQNEIIKKYVSLPIEDENIPPLHTTGGAIDVTLTNMKNNKDLDMGVKFDEFSNLTNSDAYENENIDINIRNNRRILYNAMTSAGFTNLPSEIWHYDYGDRAWAFYKNKPAKYKGIFDLNEYNNMEYLQVFDCNGVALNEKIIRKDKLNLPNGKYFMIILIFIANKDGNFLMQKTSISKGSCIATTGGHVSFGDDSMKTVIKECKEELGIDLSPQNIEFVKTNIYEKCILNIYFTKQNLELNNLKLQSEEVESVNWYSIYEIEELINNNKLRKGNIKPFHDVLTFIKNNKTI